MFVQHQACEYLEARLSEAMSEVERLELALQEAKRLADSARIMLHHERMRTGDAAQVPNRALPLLNKSIPSSLVDMAMLNGGAILVDDAADRFFEAGVCLTKQQARDNVHSALSRLTKRNGTFIKIGRSHYRLRTGDDAVNPVEIREENAMLDVAHEPKFNVVIEDDDPRPGHVPQFGIHAGRSWPPPAPQS